MSMLYVAWRENAPSGSVWGPVGRLEKANGSYRFEYTYGAEILKGFRPLRGMEKLHQAYYSNSLFPVFANRVMPKSRPDFDMYLKWCGFHAQATPDIFTLLAINEGIRGTDSIELFALPFGIGSRNLACRFFLHGNQYATSAVQEFAEQELKDGATLQLQRDLENLHDRHAVSVSILGRESRLGYLPRYLSKDISHVLDNSPSNQIRVQVERVNLGAPVQNRILCRMSGNWPDDYRPFAGPEFEPINSTVASVGGPL